MSSFSPDSPMLHIAGAWMIAVTALALLVVCALTVLEYQVVVERFLQGSPYLPTVKSFLADLRALRGI